METKGDFNKIFERYGKTHSIERRAGTKVNFTNLNKGQSVCYGDGESYHYVLTIKGAEIPEDVCIDFKSASPEDKQLIGDILIANYISLINKFVQEADYATTIGYWKDHMPTAKTILTADAFIKKYGNGNS